MTSQAGEDLSSLYQHCLRQFRLLINTSERVPCPAVQLGFVNVSNLLDEYGRFKLWGEQARANLPAEARGSLDDTIRDRSDTKALVSSILSVLQVLLKQGMFLCRI